MLRTRLCTPRGRVPFVALLALVMSWSCGGSTSESKSTPTETAKTPRPVNIEIVSSPKTTGIPWEGVGKFSVRVSDATGQGVPGVVVRFQEEGGVPEFRFTPTDTMTTDSTGVAFAFIWLGRRAGPDRVFASAAGVVGSAVLDVVITPGPAMWLRTDSSYFELFQAGDSALFRAHVEDGFNNVIPNAPFDFVVSDSTLISVTPPATQGGYGVIRALRAGGSATIKAAAVEYSLLMNVKVFPNPRTACTGVAAPQTLAVGVLTTVTDSVLCLDASTSMPGYTMIVYNASTDGATSLGTTVTATNLEKSLMPARIPSGTRPLLSRSATLLRGASAPKMDLGFHERLLKRSRSMRRLFGTARAARSFARAGSVGRIRGPSFALSGSAPSVPAVDSLITLNVADGCTTPDTRTFRVEAVGATAIVLADTANPTGGFTRADYLRFAARFDTLVYPLDVGNFDAPTDIDGNGHVAILFTRAVNELTPANANAFIGGFFNPRDLFPRTQSATFAVCPTSNEGEMFYMMVPDPTGVVNGNAFRLGFVDTLTTGVLAHEFQHLINAGRRMYVNTAASDFEETWLNEGLSHTAEELLFFRESGYPPRSALGSQAILDSWVHFAPWVSDDANNFERFFLYLSDPANHSPIDVGDDLETRGATWAFLRYAVDRSFQADFGVWRRFANSTTTGLGTLTFALQRDPRPLLKDFAVANITGKHLSWDYFSVYTQLFVAGKYPLPFGSLQDGTAVPVAAKGGSASYYRFGSPIGAQTLLRFGSSGSPPNSNLTFMLIRDY